MALVKEDEMLVEREETVACKSVAEGAAMEAIFMLSGETMTMNPRDSEHRQQSTMVVMEEEDILAAMEEVKRACLYHQGSSHDGAIPVTQGDHDHDLRDNKHGQQNIMVLMKEEEILVAV